MPSLEIPEELEKDLDQLLQSHNISKIDFVIEAIVRHMEDLQDYAIAVERLNEDEKSYSFEESKKQLGIDDD